MQRLRSVPSSNLLLGCYVVCMLLVFSFILFEVLDIDGSDFPVTSPVRGIHNAASAEEAHDLRRSLLHAHPDFSLDPHPDLGSQVLEVTANSRAIRTPAVITPPFAKTYPVTLPRSSIEPAA